MTALAQSIVRQSREANAQSSLMIDVELVILGAFVMAGLAKVSISCLHARASDRADPWASC